MRLRLRFVDALKQRLAQSLPEATVSVWGDVDPVVAIEQLGFKSTGGIERDRDADFELIAGISGFLRVELHADAINALAVEPLISDIVSRTIFLPFEPTGAITEKARLVLVELRDVVRDTQVVSAMRFAVDGALARHVATVTRPALLASMAPSVGPEHLSDYRPVTEGLA